jgi:HK97 family phage major capsid protein
MTPRISGPIRYPRRELTSLEEYRAGVDDSSDDWNRSSAPEDLFWRYVMSSPQLDVRKIFDDEEYRVLNKTTTTAGGFLVPQDLEGQIVSAARAESAMARVALELPTESGETLLLPTTTAHGTASWQAESAGYTDSPETFGQASLSAFKASSLVLVTEELMRDAGVSLDAYLAMELGGRLGLLEENAFMNGTGTGQPLGAVHASSPYTVSTAPTGNTVSYSAAAIQQFYLALGKEYRANAVWLISADDFGKLAGLVGSGGSLVFPSLHNSEPSLYGRPVFVSGELPVPAASAKSLLFGDFKRAYAVRRMRGVGVEKLVELYASVGQIGFKAYERVDGRPTLAAAAIIGAHSAT